MAGLDIIKSYLVSIGFNIDNSSLNATQQKINQAGKAVDNFAKNNSKGISSMKNSTTDISTLLSTSLGALAKIFPAFKGPLNEVTGHINLVKGVFNEFSKSIQNDMGKAGDAVNNFSSKESKNNNKPNNTNKTSNKNKTTNTDKKSNINKTSYTNKNSKSNNTGSPPPPPIKNNKDRSGTDIADDVSKSLVNVADTSKDTGVALETFESTGGEAIAGFSAAALGPLALIAATIAAIALAGVALTKLLGGMAKDNLDNQMLAKQLWTTTQNAKEINMALKTMGVTMKDLWLSPVLLAQFNQLRKDSEELKLPDSFNKNIAIVQELGFQFDRLKQAGSLAFQWLGADILQDLAGPLQDMEVWMKNFNDKFLKDIPGIAKAIAGPISIILKLFIDIFDVGKLFIDGLNTIGNVANSALGSIPKPLGDIIKLLGILALLIFSPIADVIALVLVVDDLITAFKGGKSVFGDVFKYLANKVKEAEAPFINLGKTVKAFFAGIKKWIDDTFGPVIKAVKDVKAAMKDVKDAPGNVIKSAKKIPGNVAKSVENIPGDMWKSIQGLVKSINPSVPSSSSIKNSSTSNSTSNNNNSKNTNTNTFNVSSTSPTTTASVIGKTLTNLTHNLQGVF